MPNLFYAGQTDYIEKLNTLATTESVTDGSLAASFLSLVVAGLSTFGGGMQVNAQGSAPATPASGFTIFADASDIPGWKGENGFVIKLNGTANTADRTYTLPDASGTFALLSAAQTFSAAQTVSINSASAALTLTQAGAGAALSTNGQIVSTLGSGTAPFSVVSTTVVANLNAALLNGATFAAPGTIGGGTPGAATFTTLTATGQASFAAGSAAAPGVKVGAEQNGLYSSAANTLDVTLNGVRQAQFAYTAAAVNYLEFSGRATGANPTIRVAGSDANPGLDLLTKGAGGLGFYTNGSLLQLQVVHVANAVNRLHFGGGAAGVSPYVLASGSDAVVNIYYGAKSSGSHVFATGAGLAQVYMTHTANAVNFVSLTGAATGNSVVISTGGTDGNRSITLTAAGTGTINVTNPLGLQRYTVATLPAAATDRLIIVSDESGGLVPAFSDGTNWRRVTDRAIVS